MNKKTIGEFAGVVGALAPAILGGLIVMSYLYELSFSYGLGKEVMIGNGLSDYFDNSVRWGFLILVMLGFVYFLPLSLDDENKSNRCVKRCLIEHAPFAVYSIVLIWMVLGYLTYNSVGVVIWIFASFFLLAIFNRADRFDLSKEFSMFFFVISLMAVVVSIAGYAEGSNVLHHEKGRGFCNVKIEGGDLRQGWLVKSNSKFFFFVNEKYDLFMVSSGKLINYSCVKR